MLLSLQTQGELTLHRDPVKWHVRTNTVRACTPSFKPVNHEMKRMDDLKSARTRGHLGRARDLVTPVMDGVMH